MNLYKVGAGSHLDTLVHQRVFGAGVDTDEVPAYSTDLAAANEVMARLRSRYGSITSGNTKIRNQSWFARFGTDPSTSLEVIAATYPLAICRLALLLTAKDI